VTRQPAREHEALPGTLREQIVFDELARSRVRLHELVAIGGG